MYPHQRCGCYYTIPVSHLRNYSSTRYLPLVSSYFQSTILSNACRTLLTQKFTNPSKDTHIEECVYMFPLYADVSIVKFTCRIGEKVLHGVVKERLKAKEVFDQAIAKGEPAGLLEQSIEASDVFSTKLGNIPAGESVIVEVTYIGELKNEDLDSMRFTIPTVIAPRYGRGPSIKSSARSDSQAGIKIVVDIDIPDGSFIESVQSPSHPIAVSMGTLSTTTGVDPTMSKASATLAQGKTGLKEDFVLIVKTKNSGLPKAILETHSTIPSQRALMATLVPRFKLPPSRPEIVFVADRSGSMTGNILMLISALKVFLKSMPAGIKFNICSFGHKFEFLWAKSKTYDAKTVKEASDYVASFATTGDLGGTNTLEAVQETITRSLGDIPLEIMLLTDGDIWEQEEMFAYLNEQVNSSGGKIRVFPLGIGSGVSHAFIEGIARAGNGFGQAVQDGERLDTHVVKMLRGALTPHITDYTLEIKYAREDDDFEIVDKVTDGMSVTLVDPKPVEKPTISLFDITAEPEKGDIELGDPRLPDISSPKLLQAPHKIPSLFAFSRTSVYILMSPETFQRNPTSVVLRATSEHGPLELEIPIEALTQPGDTIHQLAAKKATQDMEEGRGWVHDAKDQDDQLVRDRYPSSFDDLVKKECVRLGERYQVAGKWCSFIAVATKDTGADDSEGWTCTRTGDNYTPINFRKRQSKPKHNPRGKSGRTVSEAGFRSSQPTKRAKTFIAGPIKVQRRESSSDDSSDSSSNVTTQSGRGITKIDWKKATNEQKIHAIIELQQYDGSWSSNNESDILEILGIKTGGRRGENVNGNIWITLVVVCYVEKKMADEEGTWELVVEKAKDWLSAEGASPAELKKVQDFLGH